MLVRVYHETSVFSSSLHRQLKYDFGLLFHLFFSYFSLLCIKRFFLFFFVFCVFLCSFLRFFHLFFLHSFFPPHTPTPRHKKFFNHSITTKYQNGIFFNLLRVCRTTTKSLLREARERQQKESFGPNQSRFVRTFFLLFCSLFFLCVYVIFLISELFPLIR